MLPRRQSIFHLGEEGGVAAVHHHHHHRGGGGLVAMSPAAAGGGVRRPRDRERPGVGLQILVRHHQHHHGRHAHAANVVLKPMVRPRAAVSCSFLKSCSRCRMELSPIKDVYMYRGDQGFCSEDCRWQQILVDEARERDASSRERQRRGQAAPRHHIAPHHQGSSRPPRKALAVAY